MNEPTDPMMDGEEPTPSARRRRRSPLIDLAVTALGVWLLASMFGDLRFWMQGSEPRPLGDAAEVMAKGLPDDLDESYVVLRGTPDIQHAARLKIDERVVSYVRLIEGGGALFAAVDRTEERDPNKFEGVFQGRMRRISKIRMSPWIQAFFNAEAITQRSEASSAALMKALGERSGDGLRITDEAGQTLLFGGDDRIGLAVTLDHVQVQLGRSSFASLTAAKQAITALGVPFVAPAEQTSGAFYKFYAQIPEADRAAAEARLGEGLPAPERADASYGAAILPSGVNYYVPVKDVRVDGDRLSVAVDAKAVTGYVVDGDTLKPRPLADGRLTIDPASVRTVHLDRKITVDPDGYLIAVGETPSSQWLAPVMFATILAVVGWNLASLVWWWRRRRS
ncbi:MAG: hypothetical protein R3B09_04510 [Nannocystaceae bacterium]